MTDDPQAMTAGPRTAEGRALLDKVERLANSADVWFDDDGSDYMENVAAAIRAIEDAAFAQGVAAARNTARRDQHYRRRAVVHDPYGYRVRIAVPEDHAPDGTVARWTADASAPVGYPYTYSTIGVSVYVDFAGDDEDTPEKRGFRQGVAAARAAVEAWAGCVLRLIEVAPISDIVDETGIQTTGHSTPPERKAARDAARSVVQGWLARDLAALDTTDRP